MSEQLAHFVARMASLVEQHEMPETDQLPIAVTLMKNLVATDDWLPDEFARPGERFYQQYLLYGDPLNRFSVVSLVWGPGQATPIHDHTVWGVIGMLRGAEFSQRYAMRGGLLVADGPEERLEAGEVGAVSPVIGDIHRVRNAMDDSVSISIHVYGGQIGRICRSAFDEKSGVAKSFVSDYASPMTPNLWWNP